MNHLNEEDACGDFSKNARSDELGRAARFAILAAVDWENNRGLVENYVGVVGRRRVDRNI